jgi:hypothetical protein
MVDNLVERDAARYRYLVSHRLSEDRSMVSENDGPFHPERFQIITFVASDYNDLPMRDIGEFIDEAMEKAGG